MLQLLNDKRILLGVTGSISAFKSASIASKLTQMGAQVDTILTANAAKLIGPATFEGITHRKCHLDTFADTDDLSASHVTLGSKADLVIIAPCSANMLAKIAHGIADDKLSTTMLAVRSGTPVLIAPAMNCFMYENAATQDNIKLLSSRGMHILDPDSGNLACGYAGKGRMPEPEVIVECALQHVALNKILAGKHVLVTAGATREHIDPVRYISNPSTGKMGFACAKAAKMAGADVTLIEANTSLPTIPGVQAIHVTSARDMAEAVFQAAQTADIVIMSAAVSDFSPCAQSEHKIHKSDADLSVQLKPTTDILKTLGQNKRPGQFLCGFCMETEALLERAEQKLIDKNLDMIAANSLSEPGCGFACDTNSITVLTRESRETLKLADKLEIAIELIHKIGAKIGARL